MASTWTDAHAEELFKKKLVELGLLAKVTTRGEVPKGDRTPIRVAGKPLSKSIIDDRR